MIEFLWAWAWPLATAVAVCCAAFWVWVAFQLLDQLKRAERNAAELHAQATHWRSEFERVDEDYGAFAHAVVRGPIPAPAPAQPVATPLEPRPLPVLVPTDPVQYVVLHVRREDVLDQLRAWSAQAAVLLPLIPTTPTAANQLNTLVIELQALIHRLDGNPVGEHAELPTTPEARDPGSAAVESTMPMTQVERAIDEEDDVDVELDIPADDDDDDFEDEDFDEDDFDDDDDEDSDSDEDDYVDDDE